MPSGHPGNYTTLTNVTPLGCPETREEMKEIAGKRCRIGTLLERKGMTLSHKTPYRL